MAAFPAELFLYLVSAFIYLLLKSYKSAHTNTHEWKVSFHSYSSCCSQIRHIENTGEYLQYVHQMSTGALAHVHDTLLSA